MTPERLRLVVADRVATVTLTGADRRNAIDLAFVRQLDSLSDELAQRCATGEVDVVLLRAEGRHFCVGGDLADFSTDPALAPAHVARMAAHAHRGMDRLHELPVPVVVRVQGAVAGAGLGLVMVGDVAVGGRGATFTPAYAVVGLTPDAGVSWHLSRLLGPRRATEWLLTNRRLDAAEAQQWGVLGRVVDDADLDDEVARLVAALRLVPGEVLRETKRLLRRSRTRDLAAHLDDEADTIARLAGSAPALERMAAFLAR